MVAIPSRKNFWRILMKHGRNIRARQTRMIGTTSRMSHGYKEERILVGCEDVSCEMIQSPPVLKTRPHREK
jgi:hypothetical protein